MSTHPRQNQTVVSLLAIIALFIGSTCSSMLMGYVGGGWKRGVVGYVAWALLPYLVLVIAHLVSRRLTLHRRIQLLQTWATIVIALGGPLLYLCAMFIRVDAQGALVVLIVPVIQTAFSLLVVIVSSVWQWSITRSAAKPFRKTDGIVAVNSVSTSGITHRLKRKIKMVSLFAIISTALLYTLTSLLQHSDAKTISIAIKVDAFIVQYCKNNGRLPSLGVLQSQFPDLNRDSEWFFFTNDKTYLKMQYPMKWWNKKAIGERQISEFTATPYAYIVGYDCRNSK